MRVVINMWIRNHMIRLNGLKSKDGVIKTLSFRNIQME